jgi:hypothetical protein
VLRAVKVWPVKAKARGKVGVTANLDSSCARRLCNTAGRDEETGLALGFLGGGVLREAPQYSGKLGLAFRFKSIHRFGIAVAFSNGYLSATPPCSARNNEFMIRATLAETGAQFFFITRE